MADEDPLEATVQRRLRWVAGLVLVALTAFVVVAGIIAPDRSNPATLPTLVGALLALIGINIWKPAK